MREFPKNEKFGERLRAQRQSTRQMTASAVQGLGALFRSQEPLPDSADAALLAFCAVGRVLGMEIKAPRAPEMAVPAGSEAPSEPFETIARATHLRVRPVRLRGGWWQQDNGPLLAYRKDGHFPVALLPRGAGSYNCFDPSSRSHSPVTAANEDRYERRAFQPYRSLPTGPVTTLDLFKFALAGRGRDLAGIILLGTVIALLGMASIQAVGLIADHAIPRGDRSLLGQIGLGVVIAALGLVVAEATRGILVIRLGAAADHTLQTAVWDRLLSLRIPFFRREPSGDILIRVSAISQIHAILSGATLRTVLTSIFGLLNLGLLWAYSWHLALLGVIIAGGVAGVTLVGCLLILRYHTELLQTRGKLLSLIVQLIQMIPKVRVAAAEERAFACWAKTYSQQQKMVLRLQAVEDGVAIFNDFVGLAATMALFSVALNLTLAHGESQGLTIGSLLASLAAYGAFLGCARALSTTVTQVLQIVTLWKRAQPILQSELETASFRIDPGRLQGRIVAEHLSFRYRPDGPPVLKGVSFRAEPGEFVALVGSSGSGKSTLMRLLLGFEVPESGRVLFDEHDLSSLDLQAVRRQLGVVLQNSRLHRGSLYETIANGLPLGMEDAKEAVRLAGLDDYVARLPIGLYTQIGEDGANISGGERQRLLIAQALAAKPQFLIMDEATSSLDNRIQAQIISNLNSLKMTRIIIAHRLSTVRHADRIYVLEQGSIVQEGVYEDLARAEGPFARLLARQKI